MKDEEYSTKIYRREEKTSQDKSHEDQTKHKYGHCNNNTSSTV